MKIKRSAIVIALTAVLLAVVLMLPMMIVPTTASEVTYYANHTFEDVALGSWTQAMNQNYAAPSKATVIDNGGNKAIKLETVTADASNTTGVADANVDKNIVLSNSAVSYTDVETVVLQARYFISSDAEGKFQSQFMKFSSTEAVTNTSYLDLYRINLTTGTIYGKTSDGSGTLNKGAWNTVSMVLNLKTAAYTLYANGVLVTSNTLNRGVVPLNLTLTANNWIVAKLNKSCDSYAGYILIDDAQISTDTVIERVYLAENFGTYSTGSLTSAGNAGKTPPSLATLTDVDGNRVLKLETVPATEEGTTTTEYIVVGSGAYNVVDGYVTYSGTQYPVSNGSVTINGTTYYTSTDARSKEIRVGGANVDKNITLPNPAVSYNDADKVYLRAEYYVPAEAGGRIQSQMMSFKYVDTNGVEQSATWKSLYYLDLSSGLIKTDAVSSDNNILVRDAWNSVTMVVDLDSGVMEIYLNERLLLIDDTCTYSQLTFSANSWIVAKLNKGLSNYAGYIYIDNAKFANYSEASHEYVPASTDANGNPLWYVNATNAAGDTMKIVEKSEKFFKMNGTKLEPVYFDADDYAEIIAPVPGASIRLTNAAGIRFATQLDLDMMSELLALKKTGELADVSIGTVIAPKSYVDTAGVFTMEGLDSALSTSGAKYLNVKGTVGYYYGKLAGVTPSAGYDTYFVGSIANVKLGNRDKDFSAIGYVQVKLANGTTVYIYSYDYDANTIANYSRNVKYVAERAISDYNSGNVEFSEKELLLLNGFKNGATTLSLSSSTVIKDVRYTANELFFRNAAGVYCRLTYEGTNGWRLQANPSSYDGFDETGAGQALALYLGETVADKTEQLVITTDASKVKITTPSSGTYVTLNYTGSFNMQFYTAKDTVVSNVTSIQIAEVDNSVSTHAVTLTGALTSDEAVYGGGERFDVVNQRGNAFQLYTMDGWSNAASSYMAIPLFVTSRGAGMFINRYENMSVDFAKTTTNVWTVVLNNELMDCYFYATGRISDALFGYTEISGHSSLPEEWAQGELICRYSPDLSTFEDRPEYTVGYENYTDIPDYANYYIKRTSKIGSSSSYVLISSGTSSFYNYDYSILYVNSSGSCAGGYYQAADGLYYKAGAKGNPAGHGVKTIVTNLINAGMKPTAMVMEPFSWSNISTNATQYEELKKTVEWLDDLGIKSMFYMGVGALSGNMAGYKSEYQVWATKTYIDGSGTVEQIYKIPKTSGSGTNPDVGDSKTQQYIDITNPEAVDWYMNDIWGMMIDLGVDGIKIDFCECMPDEGTYDDTYTLEYDWYDDSVFEGDNVHHAYSTYFISLFYKSMLEQKAAKNIPDGFVVLSRGGGIGSQRNPYLWEGDQTRSFDKIEDQLIALINSGISGVPFMTYDLAGYAYASSGAQIKGSVTLEQESAIFARAIEYTAFTSTIQSHGDVRHAYQMTEETQEIYRNYTDLHEELIPYIQKYSQIACDTGMPVVRAMILEYQDDTEVYGLETQYMFGSSLLVAPVTTEGATSKSVYLPAGEWLDLNTGNTIVSSGETLTVSAALSKIPVYMKVDCDGEDQNLLADVFNGATWAEISGVQLNIEKVILGGDPWGEDPFDEEDPFAE